MRKKSCASCCDYIEDMVHETFLEYYARDGILALEMPAHSSILLVAGVDEAGTGSDEKNRAE